MFDRYGGQCAGWLWDGRQRRRCEHVFVSPDDVACWDHGVQRALGGSEDEDNFRPLCRPCTKRKDADDAGARAKVKRIRGETGNGKKRPIPQHVNGLRSRGFDPTKTKGFDGSVRPRINPPSPRGRHG